MASQLKKEVSLFGAVMYGIGVILGAGIYVLVGEAIAAAGESVWISFLLAAAISLFTVLSYAELSSRYPKAAAEYVYVQESFRNEVLSFIVGWLTIFTGLMAVVTVSLGFGGYLRGIINLEIIYGAILLLIFCGIVNFVGIKESSRINIIFTLIEMAGLVLVIFIGMRYFGSVDYLNRPYGMSGIFSAAILVFFAYIGFQYVVNIAEETRNARKVVPIALFVSVGVTTVLYILVAISIVSVIDYRSMAGIGNPLAYVARLGLGEMGSNILTPIALFATANTVLISLIVTSRIVYGMSRGGSLPLLLSRVHTSRGTPWVSIVILTFISLILIFIEDIRFLAEITNISVFVTFAMVNLSLIIIRLTKKDIRLEPDTFRVPLNVKNVSLIPVVGFVTCMFMISQFSWDILAIGGMVIMVGVGAYFLINFKGLKK